MSVLSNVWRRSRVLRVMAPVVAAAMMAAACSSSAPSAPAAASSASAGGPIQLGAILSLTGADASVSQEFSSGMETVFNDINKKGGLGGRQIQLKVLDDQSSTTIDVQDFNELESNKNMLAFFGPAATPGGQLVKPLANRDQIVYMAPLTTDSFSNPPNGWFFRTIPSISDEIGSLFAYAKQQGAKTIGFLYPDESMGTDALADAKTVAPK